MGKKPKNVSRIDSLFEKPKESFSKTGLYIRDDLHALLKADSEASGRSINKLINAILEKWYSEE